MKMIHSNLDDSFWEHFTPDSTTAITVVGYLNATYRLFKFIVCHPFELNDVLITFWRPQFQS